jgi:hypothetical protein
MDSLKPVLTAYANVTRRLNDVNVAANGLRDERRTIELDLAALYASSREELPDKINLAKRIIVLLDSVKYTLSNI